MQNSEEHKKIQEWYRFWKTLHNIHGNIIDYSFITVVNGMLLVKDENGKVKEFMEVSISTPHSENPFVILVDNRNESENKKLKILISYIKRTNYQVEIDIFDGTRQIVGTFEIKAETIACQTGKNV